ncbi:MAG: winged helix family transcriptional regulator [Desulfurellales bacterium]|nr:MAG: winged helix family transcriptional regulator [Desulfurellales bacterium]
MNKKQQLATRLVPVYHVSVDESGRLQAKPHTQVVDELFSVTPEMAVMALRKHDVQYLFVPIRDGVIDELTRRWEGKISSGNLPGAVAQLRDNYLNQAGDLIFVPRTVVADLIEHLADIRTMHSDILLEGEHLTPKQARIMHRLMQAPGVVVSPKLLSRDSGCSIDCLWVHIRRLRDKLDPARAHLRTVRDVGYYMEVLNEDGASTPVGITEEMQ